MRHRPPARVSDRKPVGAPLGDGGGAGGAAPNNAATSHPHNQEPPIRVGLNAGEPIEQETRLFGATVILASRIDAKADIDTLEGTYGKGSAIYVSQPGSLDFEDRR